MLYYLMKTKTRPEVSRLTIPNLPWSLYPNKRDLAFVLGVANVKPEANWGVYYKIVRWHRLSILNDKREEFDAEGKNYVYLKDTVGQGHTVQEFIDRAAESIQKEKAQGGLRSVHSVLIVYNPHGENEQTVIKLK